jgi:hypothetical protein
MKVFKKLIIWSVAFAIMGFIINFTIWFAYTREIRKIINASQEALKLHDVHFTYDDLSFTSFKSWRIQARLLAPSLVVRNKNFQNSLRAEAIDIVVTNFTDSMQLSLIGELNNQNTSEKEESAFSVIFNSPPQLNIKFRDDASLLFDILVKAAFNTQDFESIRQLVHAVNYSDSGWLIYDITGGKKQPYYMVQGGNNFNLENNSDYLTSSFSMQFSQKSASWLPDYKANSIEMQRLHDHSSALGVSSAKLSLTMQNGASEETKSRWRKIYGKDYSENSEITPVFEVPHVNIKNLEINTDKFDVKISGFYERQPGHAFPLIDMKLQFSNIDELLKYQQSLYNNSVVVQMQQETSAFKIKEATDEQIKAFAELIKSYNEKNDHEVKLHLLYKKDQDFVINQKPVINFLTQFLKIFADNITFNYPLGMSQ